MWDFCFCFCEALFAYKHHHFKENFKQQLPDYLLTELTKNSVDKAATCFTMYALYYLFKTLLLKVQYKVCFIDKPKPQKNLQIDKSSCEPQIIQFCT